MTLSHNPSPAAPSLLAACACTARPPLPTATAPSPDHLLHQSLVPGSATAPPFRPLGAARELFNSRRQEILLAGPAGTGKTRAALEKLFLCLLKYPATRALLVRKTRASLTQSVLVTLEEKVIPPNHPVLLGPGRGHRHSYILPNKSELVIGGMDNANRIMSTEYDMILACEATELNLSDWEKLLTRLRNAKMPYQQAIAECNPSYPEHWLNARANNGLMLRLISRHEDNPIYFDPKTAQWTPEGTRYITTLGRLSGVRRRRLLEGTWAAPEGLVYESFSANIIAPNPDSPYHLPDAVKPLRACASIDWGWRDPAAILIAVEAPDGTIYIVDEIYQSQLPIPQLMEHCRAMFNHWDVETCFADRSRPELMDMLHKHDLPCCLPKSENIQNGIARVDSRLMSEKLKILNSCHSLIAESARYQYLTESTETTTPNQNHRNLTKPGHDHAMDALRYLITGMEQTSDIDVPNETHGAAASSTPLLRQEAEIPMPQERPIGTPSCSSSSPANLAAGIVPARPAAPPKNSNSQLLTPEFSPNPPPVTPLIQRREPTFHEIWGD